MDHIKIGNQIAILRKKSDLTQEELAEKLGLTAQAVSKWENGHTLPETALLPSLSKFLNSSIDSILMPSDIEVDDVISFGSYEWRVLDVDGDKALIITENVIEKRAFAGVNDVKNKTIWENSDIRKYLNGRFYNRFSTAEQAKIRETRLKNLDNPWYGNRKLADTLDKIFLLSYEELVKYFGDSGDLKNRKGFSEGYMGEGNPDGIRDKYAEARIAYDFKGQNSFWWLRSPGGPRDHSDNDHVTAGSTGDIIWLCGDNISRKDIGVRPALWLNLT